jgi:hypothetical protein
MAWLSIVAHRKTHPEVSAADVIPPIAIVGQAGTATTILHDLLAHDPAARVPLTCEVQRPSGRRCPTCLACIRWVRDSARNACASPRRHSAASCSPEGVP